MKKIVLALGTGILAATLFSTPALAGGYSNITFGIGSGPHYSIDHSRHHHRHPRHDQRRGYHRDFGYRADYNRHGYRHGRHFYNRNHRRLVTVNQQYNIRSDDRRGHVSGVIQYDYHS